ncbi:MAG: ThiF family adenylyltransferase [Prevotella sp.]|jgi:hypothetical protein|nr:ThiF family adenylyltransferase [Prevotella sp.]
MYAALINHSFDLQRLQAEGFVMEVCDGWLVIHHIPYINTAREMKDGTLLMSLSISGDHTIRPNDHTAYWVGEQPCDVISKPLPSLVNSAVQKLVCQRFKVNFYFSCHAEKEEFPPNGDYPDYYEKVKHYFDTIAAPALCLDSEAWNLINKPLNTVPEDSPFCYMDTNASRAKITGLCNKFKGLKIGIIGLGGTGSYLLDQIAKTPVGEIHLFDEDVINNHNAFRAPGAMSEADLSKTPKKVDYYAHIYSNMHKGIIPHAVMVNSDNFSILDTLDFVFLSLDSVSAKKQIAGYLIDKHIHFIDSGMGIDQNPDGKLSGMLHVAIGTPDHYQHLSQIMGSEDAEKDEYATDIQIAELNALAANLSVIQWKKMLGFYADISHELYSVYTVNSNDIAHYEEKET